MDLEGTSQQPPGLGENKRNLKRISGNAAKVELSANF
jgi:hypothetical protein